MLLPLPPLPPLIVLMMSIIISSLLLSVCRVSALEISTPNDFINFASNVNSGTNNYAGETVILKNDLDMSSYLSSFVPVGKSTENTFLGTFDGQGHVVSNLVVSSSEFRFLSIFGCSDGITIKNLVVDKSCSFENKYSVYTDHMNGAIGGVLGQCESNSGKCIVEGCVNMAQITYSGLNVYASHLGGVIGKFKPVSYDTSITNCVNYGNISSTSSTFYRIRIGGITGEVWTDSSISVTNTIKGCVNFGALYQSGEVTVDLYIGGISGIDEPNIAYENCVNLGSISYNKLASGSASVGSISGLSNGATFKNCFWDDNIKLDATGSMSVSTTAKGAVDSFTTSPFTNTAVLQILKASTTSIPFSIINLDSKGGSAVGPIIVFLNPTAAGSIKLTLPTPVRVESIFRGWYNDEEFTAEFDASGLSAGNTTVYAKWDMNKYAVTFTVDGEVYSESSQEYGAVITYPPIAPTMDGFTFDGWNKTITTVPGHSVTIESLWTANNYNITFNVSGGDELSEAESLKTVTFNETYGKLPVPNRVGYTFTGWFNESDKLITNEMIVTTPKNHTLYANWTINTYNVTFNFGNGTTVNVTFSYNTEITYPDNSSLLKEGYTLSWGNYHEFMPAGNITVTAQWTANNYTVTFNVSGGELLPEGSSTKNVTFNEEYGDLPEPNRVGYTFAGWFNESDEFTNETTIVTTPKNHVLYAHWTANTYTVTLDADGGGGIPTSKSVVFDSAYEELPEPNRTGYTFLGWFTETPGGDPVDSSTTVTLPYSHIIYAHWIAIQYTISFDPRGGSACENITQGYNTRLTLPEPEMAGYTFLGWFDADLITGYVAKTVQAENVTLYAKWEANIYNVSFDEDCGIYNESVSVTFNSTYNLTELAADKPAILWWEVEETGERVDDGDKVKITDDITLCAVWKTNTVTLNANGGDVNPASIDATYNETYGDIPVPSMTGYMFLGWFNENGENTTKDTIVKTPKNHTLYAHWTAINYTITFDFGNGKTTRKSMAFGKSIEYPENTERDGYTFMGWVPELSTMPSEDVVITAQWEANAYTVTFDANGGNKSVNHKPVTFGGAYGELPEPERTGHTFAGWADSPFNGNNVSSTTTVRIPSNHTLYALWTVNQYVVTFDFGNGEKTPTTQSYGDAIVYPKKIPSKSFHKFRRWCTKDDDVANSDRCNVTHVPASDLTFTASFDADSSLVTDFSIAIVAVVLVIVLLVVVLVLVRAVRKVRHGYVHIGIEMDEEVDEKNGNQTNEKVEERIFKQMEAVKISSDFTKSLKKAIKKVDKNKGLDEILVGLGVESGGRGSDHAIESFRTNGAVQTAIASAAHKKEDLVATAEYLNLLYTTIREQKEYEEFDELYFGMKDIGNFMDKMNDETISFGGVVSGFTSKGKAIQFLMQKVNEKEEEEEEEEERESNGMPSGVLFKVSKGRGYKIGRLDEETDEVLFEMNSVFKVESVKEVTKDRFIVAVFSFISPTTEDEMVKL